MRTIDCPRCERLLRIAVEQEDQAVLCPGCGSRFLIDSQEGGWRAQLLERGERLDSEAVQAAAPEPPPRFDDPAALDDPSEMGEEPQPAPIHERTFYVDVDHTRTRIMKIAFTIVFVPLVILCLPGFLTTEDIGTAIFGALCVVPLLASVFGVAVAIIVGCLIAPGDKGQLSAAEAIERRKDERQDRERELRRRKQKSSKASDSATRDDVADDCPTRPGPDEGIKQP